MYKCNNSVSCIHVSVSNLCKNLKVDASAVYSANTGIIHELFVVKDGVFKTKENFVFKTVSGPKVYEPNRGIEVNAFAINSNDIVIKASAKKHIQVQASKVSPINMIVQCSVICTTNKAPYVLVNPEYIWLQDYGDSSLDIKSNTTWYIN